MKIVRILIADDHEVVREGVRAVLEKQSGWEVCGAVTNGRDAVELAEKLAPDVVVLDMTMPELNGLEAARRIKRMLPRTEILVFTAHEADKLIHQVFNAGVKSYILKADANRHLVAAVKALAEHRPYFTSKVSEVIFARYLNRGEQNKTAEPESGDRLTLRERETVQLLCEGKSNKEVAAALGISPKTVETHRSTVMRKLALESFAELVRYAIRNKIIEA
ncbi:MAG: hypothetical protein QOD99_841 [Chthoniobacter sp.]|jgi:DNA-binding NarL/FixJ family response regulator|nr:hypothetical protein [Chthoniobacter sp.]